MPFDDTVCVKYYNTSTITNQKKKIKFLTNQFDKPQQTHTVYLYVAIHYHLEYNLKIHPVSATRIFQDVKLNILYTLQFKSQLLF